MNITSLKNKNFRVQVFIDENYIFSCSQNFVIDQQLFIGKELYDEEVTLLKEKAAESILKQKLIDYASRGNYSRKELFRKVNLYAKRRYGSEVKQEVFDKHLNSLIESRIYNEKTALTNLVYLYKNSSRGRNYIFSKLLPKGFDKKEIEEELNKQNPEDFEKSLKAFLERKRPSLERKAKDTFDLKQRLIKAGMSRGFTYEQVKRALE